MLITLPHASAPAISPETPDMQTSPLKLSAFALASAAALLLVSVHAKGEERDLTKLSLEELMTIEVYTTSNYVRSLGQNPSVASVITAEDIRAQGYRTLADILRSLPGLYVTNDRNYSYLGARGFGRPEDYNSRILFLVDGYRLNENIYDSMLLGTESILDVELIERLEYTPGPGSAILYGKNAFFGVVNIITKTGAKVNGLQVSGEIGSGNSTLGRASFGRRLENGLDVLLSASKYDRDGRDLYIPDLGGTATGLDYDRYQRLFAKFTLGNWSLMAAHGERTKGIPNASYGQLFNAPGAETTDTQSLLDLSYNQSLGDDSAISGRLYYGSYEFLGDYIYDANPAPPPVTPYTNRDDVLGRWVGADLRYVSPRMGAHKWLLGADYQLNLTRDQTNFDIGGVTYFQDSRDNDEAWGLFIHDEISLTDKLTLNVGARYDQPIVGDAEIHPRLGLVYNWSPDTTLKALYGSSFRPPNAYELYYTNGTDYLSNPNLKPETIRTFELVLERHLGKAGHLTASAFHYRIADLIDYVTLPGPQYMFDNQGGARAKGIEIRHDLEWDGGSRLRTSYNWQLAQSDSGQWLDNSPRHMAKISLEQPLFATGWKAGLEVQYLGVRQNDLGTRIGGHTLVNLNLLNRKLADGLEVSARVTNLLDKSYADPASSAFTPLDRIVQDGREWSLRMEYRF